MQHRLAFMQRWPCYYLYTLSRVVVYFLSRLRGKTTPQHHNTITPQRHAATWPRKKLSFVFNAFAFFFTFSPFFP